MKYADINNGNILIKKYLNNDSSKLENLNICGSIKSLNDMKFDKIEISNKS